MERKEYNRDILERCTEFLQSQDESEVYEGVVLAAYLIEQSFKLELRKLNPLLLFDRKNISDELEIRIAAKGLSKEDVARLKTNNAKRCVGQMCEYKKELQSDRANLEELFEIRNNILHSTDDFLRNHNSAAETAVSALRICRKFIIKHLDIGSDEFNPLTSREFETLQEKQRNKRVDDLKSLLKAHKKEYAKLSEAEISDKIKFNLPKTDDYTWIENTIDCPACGECSLDEIGSVDFDWNPDGIISSGGIGYLCRVCGLDLSEYEYKLASRL